MKKRSWLFLLCLLPLLFLTVRGEGAVEEEMAQATGADVLWTALPEETADLLKEMGITGVDYQGVQEADLSDFLSALLPSVRRQIKEPLKAGGTVLVMVLLGALVSSMLGQKWGRPVERVGTAVCALTALPALTELFLRLRSVASASATFLQAYVPVLAGLTAASGRGGSATVGSAFLLGLSALLETAADRILLPAGGMLIALAAVTAGDPSPASAFADLLFRLLKWGLTLLSVVTGSMFALQTGISAVSDSLSLRGAKFAVSGLVPLVGGTLSDALGTVLSAASVIRATTGVIGILALISLLLPTLVELFLWSGLCRFVSFFAGSCSSPLTESLFDRLKKVLDVLLAATALTGAVTIFATAILMKAGGGT